jgi:hypothetical protein
MKHQTNHGGKRKGAGRKPSLDKKLTVRLRIETSKTEKVGGIEKMKEHLYGSIDILILSDEDILNKACNVYKLGEGTPSNEIIDMRRGFEAGGKWMKERLYKLIK